MHIRIYGTRHTEYRSRSSKTFLKSLERYDWINSRIYGSCSMYAEKIALPVRDLIADRDMLARAHRVPYIAMSPGATSWNKNEPNVNRKGSRLPCQSNRQANQKGQLSGRNGQLSRSWLALGETKPSQSSAWVALGHALLIAWVPELLNYHQKRKRYWTLLQHLPPQVRPRP
jgi:hypothetical protein